MSLFRLVRLTSPNLNYFIIVGAVVFYSSVYTFFYVPQTSWSLVVVVCNVSEENFPVCVFGFLPHNLKGFLQLPSCNSVLKL